MKTGISWSILLISVSFLPSPSLSAQHFPPEAELRDLIQNRLIEELPGGIVLGVMEADGSTTVVTAGEAGPNLPPLSERSVFEIGSITKIFTSILLADKVRRGEVSLSDPVSMYLPDSVRMPTWEGREITLLDLATHSSSLPRDGDNLARTNPANPFADYTTEDLYSFLSQHMLEREIGTRFRYSNVGAGLLGHVLAKASGGSYEEVVLDRVLNPLGMPHTGVFLDGEVNEWMVDGYAREGSKVPPFEVPALAGAGALRSDLSDMLRFLAANIGEPNSDLEEAIRDTHSWRRAISSNRAIGLDWIIATHRDSRILFHEGGTIGFSAFIGFDPDKEIGVVVLANRRQQIADLGIHLLNPSFPMPKGAFPLKVLGWLAGTFGLLGFLRPSTMGTLVERSWTSRFAMPSAVAVSTLFGALLLFFSSDTLFPGPITVLGIAALIRAASFPLLGSARMTTLVKWWARRPATYVRIRSLVTLGFGVFLVLSSG